MRTINGIIHCNQCGLASAFDAGFCQSCGASLAPRISSQVREPIQLRFAGFWVRAVAYLLDLFLALSALYLLNRFIGSYITAVAFKAGLPTTKIIAMRRSRRFVFNIILGFFYKAGMESSQYQGTLGKLALRIKVTDMSYQRLSYAHAVARYASKFISVLTLGIGYIMAGFNNQKQALHDKLAETFVVYR
jgi:uncharacterized RDD family membrane protein YckC